MKSVLLNYAHPIKDKVITEGYKYNPEMSVNVCKKDRTKVYIEHERKYCGLQTKTEAAREQDDCYSYDLSMQTKTYAQMEQDDQGSFYNE